MSVSSLATRWCRKGARRPSVFRWADVAQNRFAPLLPLSCLRQGSALLSILGRSRFGNPALQRRRVTKAPLRRVDYFGIEAETVRRPVTSIGRASNKMRVAFGSEGISPMRNQARPRSRMLPHSHQRNL